MKIVKLKILIGLFMICSLANGQEHIGFFKNIENIEGLGFVTRINLKEDSTFNFIFAGDLFYDNAVGTYSIKKGIIRLNYITPDFHTLTRIDTTLFRIESDPPAIYEKIDTITTKSEDISTLYRPLEMKLKRNKLIIVKYKDPEMDPKMKLKRINEENWNNSGSTYMRLIQKEN